MPLVQRWRDVEAVHLPFPAGRTVRRPRAGAEEFAQGAVAIRDAIAVV
jgi:hypothetical protein